LEKGVEEDETGIDPLVGDTADFVGFGATCLRERADTRRQVRVLITSGRGMSLEVQTEMSNFSRDRRSARSQLLIPH
jgi:hypothetical protein